MHQGRRRPWQSAPGVPCARFDDSFPGNAARASPAWESREKSLDGVLEWTCLGRAQLDQAHVEACVRRRIAALDFVRVFRVIEPTAWLDLERIRLVVAPSRSP